MRSDLVDILACPLDGHAPLHCFPLEATKDTSEEIMEGFLICPGCASAFAIVEGIPHLVRGGLRRAEYERGLFNRHTETLKRAGKELGLPRPVSPPRGEPSDHDQRIMAEGDYWAKYLKTLFDRGDHSVLDVRCSGSHEPFLYAGVAEREDRDKDRETGMWPPHLSRPISERMRTCRGRRALDVGCGGGQFGLQAAYEGAKMVGMDISIGSLEIARRHARDVGQEIQYVYADPAQPPFREQVFDLILGKDALHHIPGVEGALRRLDRSLAQGGRILFYEHVGDSPGAAWLRRLATWLLLPRIQRRYERVEIPGVFKQASVHEDAGRDQALPALRAVFHVERVIEELFLYYEIEELVYFASGKKARLARACGQCMYWLERLLLLFAHPNHVTVFGRKKSGS